MPKKASLMSLPKVSDLEKFIKGDAPEKETPPAPPEPAPKATATVVIKPKLVKTQTPKALNPPTPKPAPQPANTNGVEGGTVGGKKTSLNIDPELHRQLKILAIQKSRKLQDLFNEAVTTYLKANGN